MTTSFEYPGQCEEVQGQEGTRQEGTRQEGTRQEGTRMPFTNAHELLLESTRYASPSNRSHDTPYLNESEMLSSPLN